MNTQILKNQTVLPDIHFIYLMNKGHFPENISLTKSEQTYFSQEIASGKTNISINAFYRWMFFYVIDQQVNINEQYEKLRREASNIFEKIKENKIKEIQIVNKTNDNGNLLSFIEGLLLSQYSFDKYLSNPEKKTHQIEKIVVIDELTNETELNEVKNICSSVYFSRDLINEPPNTLNTIYLAEQAKNMAHENGISIKVYDKKEIEAMGMGGLLAVNRGSVDPPVFIHLTYKPHDSKNTQPFVFVGKGITFDSGGLNIKPGDSMDGMKSDMSGAAAVLGCMAALAKNNIPVYVIGLIPSTDNRPGFNAFAPGDIIRMMDGSTVEMLNSDAEGRMILADALHFAKQFNPSLVIDIATLTGSASAAVGRNATVAFAKTDESIFNKLETAAFKTWERIVRFPLWDDYADMLKSEIADAKNIGNRHAGAITAAKFLERFTRYPWIHLDIAGPAFLDKKDSYRSVGGTAVGVRMVYEFLKYQFVENN
ncbi:MAG TPA: leucyl aminopeptidase [Bacteroidales bacterium]|jgi:leucyl aminopeptidase|nr:leucyl aminopeptidase [Bacteroidales bacterium]HOU98013.1 leucyl aminopeptidase [Bacteroidales bacterium]